MLACPSLGRKCERSIDLSLRAVDTVYQRLWFFCLFSGQLLPASLRAFPSSPSHTPQKRGENNAARLGVILGSVKRACPQPGAIQSRSKK